MGRGPGHSPYFVGCCRAWSSLPSYLTSGHWMRWSNRLGWTIISMLYISASVYLSDAMDALSQSLEAVGAWMGCNGLQLNPCNMEWLWVLGLSSIKVFFFPSLILDGVALSQMDPIWASFWTQGSCLEEQVASVARRAFMNIQVVYQLHPFLDWKTLFIVIHVPMAPHLATVMCSTKGCPWRAFQSFNGTECNCTISKWCLIFNTGSTSAS